MEWNGKASLYDSEAETLEGLGKAVSLYIK